MTTKEKILWEALHLFSERGYRDVSVGQIAGAVGIKAPSLYKHFQSKQHIFGAIVEQLKADYEKQTAQLNISSGEQDVQLFSAVSEDTLIAMGKELFLFFLHDEKMKKFRKMLTLEQFRNPELAALFSEQYIDGPLTYQTAILAGVSETGLLAKEDAKIMALHFYGPMYLLLTMCDRQPDREEEALGMLHRHIAQFNKVYGRRQKL